MHNDIVIQVFRFRGGMAENFADKISDYRYYETHAATKNVKVSFKLAKFQNNSLYYFNALTMLSVGLQERLLDNKVV